MNLTYLPGEQKLKDHQYNVDYVIAY
jgi:hypothetical protein